MSSSSMERLERRSLLSGEWLTGAALWADAERTTAGLVGTYIDADLTGHANAGDWRITEPVAGTRLDDPPDFPTTNWGVRSELGLTGGTDSDWDLFSVQWDGYLEVTQALQRFATVSDDGSRMWIDANRNGVFEDAELLDNGWGRWQGSTLGERSAGLPAAVYPIRIQYCEAFGGNMFLLVSSPYVPPQFIPTATNPRQVVRVIVLNFDPRVPSEQNKLMHEVFGWSDPRRMARQFEFDLEWATGGAIDIEVVEWRELDAFPTFTDGYRYNPDEYVANRRSNTGWHETGTDFYELVDSQNLLPLINAGEVDEIWTFGDHYFSLLGEAWMGGPNSFFVNGPSFSDAGFDRAIAGYGFSYERAVGEMLHNLAHRTENHGQRAFGSWNLQTPMTAWDSFSSNYLDTAEGPYGVGTCHVPANADDHYDYADERTVDSIAPSFVDYPAPSGPAVEVGRDTWGMGPSPDYHRDYLNWYFASMPRNDGTDADARAANWYKYIWDFNAYEPDTGRAREEDAFGAGPIVRRPGGSAYDLTVRYYDETGIDPATLDDADVRVITPGGATLNAVLMDAGTPMPTTAGTARTATYRIVPPGGAWDALDNGTYRIVMQSDQVRDLGGALVPGGEIGTFRAAIPDPALINVSAMLAAGTATASHTAFDIGPVSQLFDGNTSTLVRTPNIDPAVITLTFDAPQTVTGFRAFFSHAGGNPAYRYTIESADSQADLDSHAGSYRMLVPLTGTASDVYSSATLAAPHAASIFRLTATRLTGDDYVHVNEWQLLGTAAGETDGPVASLGAVAESQRGQTAQFLTVTFSDAAAVDVVSLGNGDLRITGPGGLAIVPTFYDVDEHTDGQIRTATYWFIPPGGAWDHLDNGGYTIELAAESVNDILLNPAVGAVLGTFDVEIDPPQRRPAADLAEANASDWVAWADGATASVSDDTTRTTAGEASIRFDTSGGFDTLVRYGAVGAVDWDLSAASQLKFSIYAENPSPFGFQEGPCVRLHGTNGGYHEYHFQENGNAAAPINGAVNQWATFSIPLAGSIEPTGWWRTTVGAPDMAHIASVEFHADTWDNGFTLWLDDVGFDLPSAGVVGRHVFYNNCAMDGNTAGLSPLDDAAIADRQALLPGGTATGANSTAYNKGLNGIMVDIEGLGDGGELNRETVSSYFRFEMGSGHDPAGWTTAPDPQDVAVRVGAGTGGSDRVTIIWAEGLIRHQWLRVTVLSDVSGGRLGLIEDDVFSFGNTPGDATGDGMIAGDDYFLVDRDFLSGQHEHGDFTGDAMVDGDDYFVIDSALLKQPPIPAIPPAYTLELQADEMPPVMAPALTPFARGPIIAEGHRQVAASAIADVGEGEPSGILDMILVSDPDTLLFTVEPSDVLMEKR